MPEGLALSNENIILRSCRYWSTGCYCYCYGHMALSFFCLATVIWWAYLLPLPFNFLKVLCHL